MEFEPKVGLVTKDAYLHGCGSTENILCPGQIVYLGENYFVLEDAYNRTAFVVHEDSYWIIQEDDFI